MRTIILSAILATLVAAPAHAQKTTAAATDGQKFHKGTNVLSGLIGIGTSLSYLGSVSPAFSVNFEHGAWQAGDDGVVSIGAYAGRLSSSYTYSSSLGGYKTTSGYTIVGLRSAYHYTGLDDPKIDLYGGIMLSYSIYTYKISNSTGYYAGSNYSYTSPYGSTAGFTGFVGGRYFFNPRVGANVELGYGVAYLNAGISLKF